MEKIEKFENCKIENLNDVKGGGNRIVNRYWTLNDANVNMRDKDVFIDGELVKAVSNLDSWFNRDKMHY
jgi:hypothetical protein